MHLSLRCSVGKVLNLLALPVLVLVAGNALVASDVVVEANAPVAHGQRIFAVHHSFHEGGFYNILAEITQSAGITDSVMAGNFYIGGSTVIQHWNGPSGKAAQEALTAGTVDVLTTTPIYLPDAGIENFATLGHQHNPAFRMTVMEFWLPFDNYEPGNYRGGAQRVEPPKTVDHNAATGELLRRIHAPYVSGMDELIRSINGRLNAPVVLAVPVGQAVIALREKIAAGQAPGLKAQWDLFTDPLGHPKPALSVMMAYCHFSVIYRRSPLGLPTPKVLGPDGAALNQLLQEMAWDAVIHHPLSGVTATP